MQLCLLMDTFPLPDANVCNHSKNRQPCIFHGESQGVFSMTCLHAEKRSHSQRLSWKTPKESRPATPGVGIVSTLLPALSLPRPFPWMCDFISRRPRRLLRRDVSNAYCSNAPHSSQAQLCACVLCKRRRRRDRDGGGGFALIDAICAAVPASRRMAVCGSR